MMVGAVFKHRTQNNTVFISMWPMGMCRGNFDSILMEQLPFGAIFMWPLDISKQRSVWRQFSPCMDGGQVNGVAYEHPASITKGSWWVWLLHTKRNRIKRRTGAKATGSSLSSCNFTRWDTVIGAMTRDRKWTCVASPTSAQYRICECTLYNVHPQSPDRQQSSWEKAMIHTHTHMAITMAQQKEHWAFVVSDTDMSHHAEWLVLRRHEHSIVVNGATAHIAPTHTRIRHT